MRRDRTIYAIAIAAFVAAAPAAAQEDDKLDRLREIKREIDDSKTRQGEIRSEAITLTRELRVAAKRMVDVAAQVQESEEAVNIIEARVDQLAGEEAKHKAVLEVHRAELATTLAALERLSLHPPALALVRPDDAVSVVRSAGLVTGILPTIRMKADEIRGTLDELSAVRSSLEDDQELLSTHVESLNAERRELERLKQDHQLKRQALFEESQDEKRRVAKLALEAKDIAGLLRGIRSATPKPRARPRIAPKTNVATPRAKPTPTPETSVSPDFRDARGALALPARGQLAQGYGDETQTGKSRGIRIVTRAGAQVVAPYDGKLVYAGPFRDYGQLLIIEHSDGYHTLLSGMERLEVAVGQSVVAGEPVGVMGQRAFTGGGQSPASRAPQLYIELRHDGEPINPMPWLSARLGNRG